MKTDLIAEREKTFDQAKHMILFIVNMATEIKLLTRLHLNIHGVLPPEPWGTFWFLKKINLG